MRHAWKLLAALPAALLAACGTAVHGSGDAILVETVPPRAANCLLENARGAWSTAATPASVAVDRARSDLKVTCRTSDGWHGTAVVRSHAEPFSPVGAFGNGGAAVAAASAAAHGTAGPTALGVAAVMSSGEIAGAAGAVAIGSALADIHTGAAWGYPDRVAVRLIPPSQPEVADAPAHAVERPAVEHPAAATTAERRRAPRLRSAPEVSK